MIAFNPNLEEDQTMSLTTTFVVDFVHKSSGATFCQGSFINNYILLTAAQCLLKYDLNQVSLSIPNGTDYNVGPGDVPMVHESFAAAPLRHDIGLLFLENIVYPYAVQIIDGKRAAPALTTANGWGLLQYGLPNDLLAMPRTHPRHNQNEIRVMDELRCIQDGRTKTSTCIGYPGGPLLCGTPTQPRLCGLSMFKHGSTVGSTNPAAYTEVWFYSDWIASKRRCACCGTTRNLHGACATTLPKIDLETGEVTSHGLNPVSMRRESAAPIIPPDSVRTIVRHTFEVNYIHGSPDGVEVEHILGINGRFPGPTIHALPGDIVEVNVNNRIWDGQPTSIHWHGLTQAGTPFEDGPAYVSQCPIKAGKDYVYRFPIRYPGTHWYHSHVGSQYTEGLWGLLVIHNLVDLHPFDTVSYITLKEWYHRNGTENEHWHLSPASLGAPPFPDSGLMNGVGRFRCRFTNKTCQYWKQTFPNFALRRSEVNKLVVANVGGYSTYNFEVEDHDLKVIEIDGMETSNPEVVKGVYLGAGQRMSVILILLNNDTTKWDYSINAKLNDTLMYRARGVQNINPNPERIFTDIVGRIRYFPESQTLRSPLRELRIISEKRFIEVIPTLETFPRIEHWPSAGDDGSSREEWGEGFPSTSYSYSWKAMQEVKPPVTADVEFTLNLTFVDWTDGVRRACFNEHPFVTPAKKGKPLLTRMLENITFPTTNPFLEVGYGQVVDIVLNNLFQGPHPVHLHGHHFWVMALGVPNQGVYDPTNEEDIFKPEVRRDTVMVESKSFAVIRFVADNPGVWAMHCHIDWHQLSGMRIVIKEAQSVARRLYNVPSAHVQLCSKGSSAKASGTSVTK